MTVIAAVRTALEKDPTDDIERVLGDSVPWEGVVARAAVLMAITDRSQPGLILTQRPLHMRNHAGQIAFPGGRSDPTDADAAATALREAREEIALNPGDVRLIGFSDTYSTGSGYHITPVLGLIPPDLPLHPNADEVAEIFEVPLSFVLDPANQSRKVGKWRGVMRHYYEIVWQDRIIWGATAGMLVNLTRRLR